MPIIKKKKRKISIGKDVKELEPSHNGGGNVKQVATLENSLEVSQIIKY